MKTTMAALAASLLLAGAAAPARAETDVTRIAEELAEKLADRDVEAGTATLLKMRRFVPRQLEFASDEPEFGSAEWWRQKDRDRPSRR